MSLAELEILTVFPIKREVRWFKVLFWGAGIWVLKIGKMTALGNIFISMRNPSFSETFQAVPNELTLAREFIHSTLEKLEIQNKTDILIAVGEALQNIVRHAYVNIQPGHLLLSITKLGDVVEIIINDDAPSVNPELFMHQTYSPSESGGMGIELIKKIALEFRIDPQPDGNMTTLKFHS